MVERDGGVNSVVGQKKLIIVWEKWDLVYVPWQSFASRSFAAESFEEAQFANSTTCAEIARIGLYWRGVMVFRLKFGFLALLSFFASLFCSST